MQGIELSRRFYTEIVAPMMTGLTVAGYSAALVGTGSEVLGFDTEMSQDHDFGPRVVLLVDESDRACIAAIRSGLEQQIPQHFLGYPVDAGMTRIETFHSFIDSCLSMDLNKPVELLDWLTFPSQTLLELTSGDVFHDDHGRLSALRSRLRYYPDDVWLYIMASIWQRIGQEEHLMLRAGFAGDELGSAVIASRIVRDIMNLCFCMERTYAPYPKWFGSAFGRLNCAEAIRPYLWAAQTAAAWRGRESALNAVYPHLVKQLQSLGVAAGNPQGEAASFYGRPFNVMDGGHIAQLLIESIQDAALRRFARKCLIGSIDQITDNTDFRTWNHSAERAEEDARGALKRLYQAMGYA
ncbi:DUF4037 domain-containing protein [Paenibacillus sp. R14(2021)]|uniref:DUF4037 domain-containing protein n=1 Tax=Paenibacillus sp. R14(2021) TaxID=2859228 RepID=UPI0021585AB0|nr:DUF4037 domain-containing protein [Paenibacillus sp. R14(2021)]